MSWFDPCCVRQSVGRVFLGSMAMLLASAIPTQAETPPKDAKEVSGREIFLREWLPNDARSHGGDGLGPVFNDSSCVACHNQGGAGGGGAASKNVNIVSATFNQPLHQRHRPQPSVGTMLVRSVLGLNPNPNPPAREMTKDELTQQRADLVEEISQVHPGFQTASSVVVHHFGANDEYEGWKTRLLTENDFGGHFHFAEAEMAMRPEPAIMHHSHSHGEEAHSHAREQREFTSAELRVGRQRLHQMRSQVTPVAFSSAIQRGHFAISQSQRNATALFGAGMIDAVPNEALEKAAKKKYAKYPEVSGRIARLPDGKIGRFGWKSQKATLREFTVTACAVELGLHVPEHPQSGDPNKPDYKPAGFDLTRQECDSLVEYLRDLPAPTMRKAAHPQEETYLKQGQALFASVGCATCHTEDLGTAKGIYSDLLVHDLGEDLGDTGSYGVFLPDSPGGDDGSPVPPITKLTAPVDVQPTGLLNAITPKEEDTKITGTTRLEWRTPPLWGVRDSAPYLHDGRAKTLEQAIAMHGGEGDRSALHFFSLSPSEQRQVVFFLKSLEAPSDRVANR